MVKREDMKSMLGSTPECLSLQQLERLASGEVPGDPHLENCAHCQAELEMLKAFEADQPLADEGAAVTWISARLEERLVRQTQPKQPRIANWWQRLFASTSTRVLVPSAALLAIVLAVVWLRPSREPELLAHLGNGPEVSRSGEVAVLRPSGTLAVPPQRLEWSAYSGASQYSVQITEVDSSVLYKTQTNDTFVTIPASVAAKLLPDKAIQWRVDALDAQGKIIASSPLEHFVVAR